MQVVEKKNEGLAREYAITVAADEIRTKVDERLSDIRRQVRVPGFRPGRAPVSVMKQRYGKAVLGEVLESTVQEGMQRALSDHGLRPAAQPKVELQSFDEGRDLEYTVAVEVLPEIQPMDFSTIEIERLVPLVDDEAVDQAMARMAAQFRDTKPIEEARASQTGDVVVLDFVGKIDGEAFEGGSGEDYHLELGSDRFIPGVEEQLTGVRAGEEVEVSVNFPDDYGAKQLAGKPATFSVKVKEIRHYVDTVLDDEFAKSMGHETLGALREAVRASLAREYGSVARDKLKRELLDKLEAAHSFELPPSMVEAEFDSIWQQLERARQDDGAEKDDVGKSEDELRAEYRRIAERRVLLGLLLTEVGTANNIEVSAEEVNRALFREAQKYPGRERELIQLYQNNPQAMAGLRAPIFEDKVIDFIVEMAKVSEREVPIGDLVSEQEDAGKEPEPAAST